MEGEQVRGEGNLGQGAEHLQGKGGGGGSWWVRRKFKNGLGHCVA